MSKDLGINHVLDFLVSDSQPQVHLPLEYATEGIFGKTCRVALLI